MANISPWKRRESVESESGLRPLSSFHRDIDNLFDNFFRGFSFPAMAESGANLLTARLDIAETDKAYQVNVELPGVDEKDIDISISGDVLTISGEKKAEEKKEGKNFLRIERSYGSFQRAVTLPKDVDTNNIKASFRNGVLDINVPKTENAKPSVKKIKVENSQN